MSQYKVTLIFDTEDPRRPEGFLRWLTESLPDDILKHLDTGKCIVIDPPNPSSLAAQLDGQLSAEEILDIAF